jgi:hypothetical protein
VQVRVEKLDERSFTLVTLEGHPLAGVVRFHCEDGHGTGLRFSIDVVERPASRVDQVSMALVGSAAQKRTWKQTAENVCALAGGHSEAGVTEVSWSLDDEAAEPYEDWIRDLVQEQDRRNQHD